MDRKKILNGQRALSLQGVKIKKKKEKAASGLLHRI